MYKKEDFKISLPSTEYLKNSKLIKKIGIKCKDLNNDLTDYWTSDNKSSVLNVNIFGNIMAKNVDSNSGVRPLIKAKNMSNIIQNSNYYVNEQGILIIEFGSWYSSNTTQLNNPINLSFTGRSYPIGETKMGLEFESDNKRYVLFNDKLRPVIPIKWYYDKEYNLLLSVNSLFYSLKNVKLYEENSAQLSIFDILEGQVLPLILNSENIALQNKVLKIKKKFK